MEGSKKIYQWDHESERVKSINLASIVFGKYKENCSVSIGLYESTEPVTFHSW